MRPATLGATWFASLSVVGLLRTLGEDQVQGVSAPSVRKLIKTRFAGEVLDAALLSMASALLLGLVLGAAAGMLLRLRDQLGGRSPRPTKDLALPALGLVVVAHAWLWMLDLATNPQTYALGLYARGGVRAWFQVAVCDWLGRGGVILAGVGALAAWLGPPLWRARRQRRSWLVGTFAGALVVALALSLFPFAWEGLTARSSSQRAAQPPNVLILAADSLRADRLDPRVAPELSALAARGARFERAYVSLPRTFPSWVSVLSGKDPHHHGIRHMFPRWEARARDNGAIPRSFAAAGYHTAVISDFAGDIFRRIDMGFANTRTPTFNIRELVREIVVGGQGSLLPLLRGRTASKVLPVLRELHDTTDPFVLTADVLAEIDRAGNRPFFVVAFYSTTHFPYSAPSPYWSRFVDPKYRGPYRYGKMPSLAAEHKPTDEDIRALRAQFDGSVAAVDAAAAQLLAGIRRRGLAEHTIVVVTSDHGESLYEPGRGQGHGDHLFGDEVTHVPLVIADPRRTSPVRIASQVRSVDLAPTLCELAQVRCAEGVDGRSLVPLLDKGTASPRLVYAETGIWFTREIPDVPLSLRLPYPDLTEVLEVDLEHEGDLVAKSSFEPWLVAAKHRMVRDDRFKLIYAPTREGVRWMLFDTQSDPQETREVSAEHPEVVARLQTALWQWMLEDPGVVRRGDLLVPRALKRVQEGVAP